MNITIKINTDNIAFDEMFPEIELSRILNKLLNQIENTYNGMLELDQMPLYDSNGNKVGEVNINE